jgi:hypothetical protein
VGALQVSINIGTIYDLSLSTSLTDLPVPTPAIYDAGYADTNGPVATIRSNAPWSLSISALTPTWSAVNTGADPARPDKPASDLAWSVTSGGPFTDLATSPAQVAAGNATAGQVVTLFYRTRYLWAVDTPGSYSLQIVFTIASP